MRLIKRWKAKVLNGKLTLKSTKLWNKNLQLFENKEVELTIRKWTNKSVCKMLKRYNKYKEEE